MPLPSLLARLFVRSGAARFLPGLQRRLDGGADFLRYCSDRLLASPVGLLEEIAAGVAETTPDIIDLAPASPRFDLTPSFTTRLPTDRRGWPDTDGLPELRGAIAAKLLADNRLAFSPAEEVLVTSGALGAAGTILDAFVNRSDAVALLDPISPLYPLLLHTRGARVRWIGSRTEDGRLRPRFDHLSRALRGARLLVLNSPANPTGGILAAEDLEQIAWWAARQDVLILSDEVFERFAYDGEPTSMATLPRARSHTVTVGSISKSHALAAARVGWIAAHRHLLRACRATAALRSPFVPTLSQLQALQALRTPATAFEPIRAQMEARRRHVCDRLRAMGLDVVWPAGGLFVWAAIPTGWKSGRAFADALLSGHRVRVLPGHLFGPSGKRFVRVSYVADDGRLDEGLNRIAQCVGAGRKTVRRAA